MEHASGTRERLLSAAVSVISEEGVKGIRIRDIAASAGVREPSVYHFFGSREGLVEAALIERFGIHLSQIFHAFGQKLVECRTQDDFVAAVREVLSMAFHEDRAAVRSMRADVIGSAQSRPELKNAINEAMLQSFSELGRYLQDAQIRGWVDPTVDTITVSAWLTSIINGRVYIEMNPDPYDFTAWDKYTVDAALLAFGYVDGKQNW
jgi:AcrR family transcriptional regulator